MERQKAILEDIEKAETCMGSNIPWSGMMNLIKKVAELRTLEADDSRSIQFFGELLKDAPALLEVLECFREGDADALDVMATYFEMPQGAPSFDYIRAHWAAVLRRMADAAKLMEAKQE